MDGAGLLFSPVVTVGPVLGVGVGAVVPTSTLVGPLDGLEVGASVLPIPFTGLLLGFADGSVLGADVTLSSSLEEVGETLGADVDNAVGAMDGKLVPANIVEVGAADGKDDSCCVCVGAAVMGGGGLLSLLLLDLLVLEVLEVLLDFDEPFRKPAPSS